MALGWKTSSKDVNSSELKTIEMNLKAVEEQKKQVIYQLGEIFYNANKDVEGLDEAYRKKIDTVCKLDYNYKVWQNRRMKMQGMRTCIGCGNVLPYDSFFCNKCGAKLEAVAEELVLIQE